jgi:hypothetical protein
MGCYGALHNSIQELLHRTKGVNLSFQAIASCVGVRLGLFVRTAASPWQPWHRVERC